MPVPRYVITDPVPGVLLFLRRRGIPVEPYDGPSDTDPPASDTTSDTPNAPSDSKPTGRSSARKKPKEG